VSSKMLETVLGTPILFDLKRLNSECGYDIFIGGQPYPCRKMAGPERLHIFGTSYTRAHIRRIINHILHADQPRPHRSMKGTII